MSNIVERLFVQILWGKLESDCIEKTELMCTFLKTENENRKGKRHVRIVTLCMRFIFVILQKMTHSWMTCP